MGVFKIEGGRVKRLIPSSLHGTSSCHTRGCPATDYVDTELGIEQTIQIAASSFRTFDIIPICGYKKCMLKKNTSKIQPYNSIRDMVFYEKNIVLRSPALEL